MEGWIKLHRKLQDSRMYKALNSKQRDVMIQCLLMANHDENEWEWGAKIYNCKKGQFITSLDSLCDKCGKDVKIQSVRTSLLKLEKWGFLTVKSTKTGRLITICKWETYQSKKDSTNKDSNKEPTKSQQRANKELTTNKNVKELEEGKEAKKYSLSNQQKLFELHKIFRPKAKSIPSDLNTSTYKNKVDHVTADDIDILREFYSKPKSDSYDQTWNRKTATAQLVNQIGSQIELAKAYFEEPINGSGAPVWNPNVRSKGSIKYWDEQLRTGKILEYQLPKWHESWMEETICLAMHKANREDAERRRKAANG